MGDRGNIFFVQHEADKKNKEDRGFYFYSHWGGEGLPATLKAALKRGKGRWDDPPYLARIIFSEMIQHEVLQETGYGISLEICDNEHKILEVLAERKCVRIGKNEWGFQEFIDHGIDSLD